MDKKELASRRIKSLRAKGKHPQKAKTTPTVEHSDNIVELEETIGLPNNWSRYKEIESDEEDLSRASDFQTLLQAPLSTESNFKFKSEQSWNSETPEFNKYFTLDLDQLSKGIACIPFHNILNINESVFTKSQLESINCDALRNKEMYLKLYPLHKKVTNIWIQDLEEESITDDSVIQNDVQNIKNNLIFDKEKHKKTDNLKLFDDESIHNENTGKNKVDSVLPETKEVNIPANQTKKELESWLDDLLDSDDS